ncbi:MAG: PA14 domain-containing protein [Proteobacteria bacterium]|nr:PA14 domain-containing protein [Pseudomonadota bacterium]
MILRFKDRFRPKERGGPPGAGIPGDRESGAPGGAKNRSRFSGRFGAVAIFLCLAAYVFLPSDTPAQDPLTQAGFGYLRGLKGEYFDNSDPRFATTVEPVRGATAPNPWSYNTSACTNANDDDCDGAGTGGPDSTSCCCPQHLNVNAARLEDGKEALLSTLHTGNAIRLKDFPMSRYGDPEITDALVWVRYMCRRQSPAICAAVTTAFTADDTDPVQFRIRFRGQDQSMTTADITGCPSDFQWISFSLCGNTSPATPWKCDPSAGGTPLTWKELGEKDNLSDGEQNNIGITIELYVVGDQGSRGLDDWRWILWDVGYIEVISDPMLRGSRVDPLVDFGPGYTVDWRGDDSPAYEGSGGPSDMLLNRSATVNVANILRTEGAVDCGADAAIDGDDANNLTTAYTCDNTTSLAGNWYIYWGAAQYINKVKIYWNTQIGSADVSGPLSLQYSPDTTNGTDGAWYTLKTIYREAMAGDARGEQTYAFSTVSAKGFRILKSTTAGGFSFWEFHAYAEEYDYFEARWIGEVKFDSADTRRLCTVTDAGSRLFINEDLRFDAWSTIQTTPTKNFDPNPPTLTDGWHQVRMEYYDWTGGAAARLGYCSDDPCTTCTPIPTDRLRASWEGPTNFSFLSGWFANFWLDLTPTSVNPEAPNDGIWKGFEHQQTIDFNWAAGAPCPLKKQTDLTNITVTILNENFDSAGDDNIPAGWTRTPDGACNVNTWGNDCGNSRAGTHSGSCAQWCRGKCYDSGTGPTPFVNNMNTYLMYGPFNLSDATAASYSFYAYIDQLDLSGDDFYYYASLDGATWHGPASIDTNPNWTTQYTMDLANVTGYGSMLGPSVWIAFRFTSDGATATGFGSFVDDVVITKVVPTPISTWNARYTGFIRAECAGTLSVCLTQDGGARLDLDGNGSWEIDTWAGKTAVERRCYNRTVTTPGEIYTVLEYYDQNTTDATLKLEWIPVCSDMTSALDLKVVNDYYLDYASDVTRALYHLNEGPSQTPWCVGTAGVTVCDSAGAQDKGTITGAQWTQEEIGEVPLIGAVSAPKLYFDGVGDYIDVPDSVELSITGRITIEAWVKAEPCGSGSYYPFIVKKGDWIDEERYALGYWCNNGLFAGLYFGYDDGVQPSNTCERFSLTTSAFNITDGQWHYVAVTSIPGGNQPVRFYVGTGSSIATDTKLYPAACGVTMPDGDDPLQIGGGQFAGFLDEVRISATALDAGGTPRTPTPGLGFSPSDSWSHRIFDMDDSWLIGAGDYLEYDIFLPETNPPSYYGGLEASFAGAGCPAHMYGVDIPDSGPDCTGVDIDTNANLATCPNKTPIGQWAHRKFNLTTSVGTNLSNCTMSKYAIVTDGELRGVYSVRLDDINITNGAGSVRHPIYSIGAPKRDILVTDYQGETPSIVFSRIDAYEQGINILPSQFLYANGLRRFVYESEYEALAWPPAAGAQQSYFSRQVCQAYDNVVDHLWTGTTDKPEYAGSVTASESGDRKSIFPDCSGKTRADHWAIRWEGSIYAPAADGTTYTFEIVVNEVGKLTIDNSVVISNCGTIGTDSPSTCTGTIDLNQGWHYLDLDLIEGTGSARAQLNWNYGAGWARPIPKKYFAMRQYIPGAIEGAGGVGPGREAGSNPMLIFNDIMDMFNKAIANTGFTCSTVFDGSAETDAQLLNALRGLRDYFLAKSRIGEIYARLYYRISNPISRVLEAYPFLKQAARTVLNPVVQLAKTLEGWTTRKHFTLTQSFPPRGGGQGEGAPGGPEERPIQ